MTLSLGGNALHALPRWLRRLPRLEYLSLRDNPLPKRAVAELARALPRVKIDR